MQDQAARLKILRSRLKLTQTEMAERLGISLSLYSKIEIGRHKLRSALANTICGKLGISESWLQDGKGALPEKLLPEIIAHRFNHLLSIRRLEEIIKLAQHPEFRELAEQIADTMQLSFPRALAIVIQEKINPPATSEAEL